MFKIVSVFSAVFTGLSICAQYDVCAQVSPNKPAISTTLLTSKNPDDFVPKGYVISDKILGDLNKDGAEDWILLVKGTDKKKIIRDETRGLLDRNRRGILVLLKKSQHYQLFVQNLACFSSENEDGGVYFPPELSCDIDKGNLYILYSHGRYGYWKYTFKVQNLDLDLIGYDQSDNNGPIVSRETSINFITKRKQEKVNTNEDSEGGDEVFKETWKNIRLTKRLKLSEIKDFDNLDMSIY